MSYKDQKNTCQFVVYDSDGDSATVTAMRAEIRYDGTLTFVERIVTKSNAFGRTHEDIIVAGFKPEEWSYFFREE